MSADIKCGAHNDNKISRAAPPMAASHTSMANLNHWPETATKRTAAAMTISVREGMAHHSFSTSAPKGHSADDIFVAEAFESVEKGTGRARSTVTRVNAVVHECPRRRDSMALATSKYLAGVDVVGTPCVLAQTIIRRLNIALDGPGSRITRAILTDAEIARLRIFRLKVRETLKT